MFTKKITNLLIKYKEIIMYLIFGVLTTAVSIATYYACTKLIFSPQNPVELQAANVVSWIISVTFAYVTNKLFVFESKSWNSGVLGELLRFVGSRVTSGVIETVSLLVTVDILGWNGNIMKLFLAVIVIVLNYILSKFFVFKK